jgi:hypothetical protein
LQTDSFLLQVLTHHFSFPQARIIPGLEPLQDQKKLFKSVLLRMPLESIFYSLAPTPPPLLNLPLPLNSIKMFHFLLSMKDHNYVMRSNIQIPSTLSRSFSQEDLHLKRRLKNKTKIEQK